MTDQARQFVDEITEAVRPLFTTYTHAVWEAAISGSDEANEQEKETQAALMRFWADGERHDQAKRLSQADHDDALIERTLKVIFLSAAKAQQDEATIQELTELEASIRAAYYNFRAEIDGQRLTDNQLDNMLRTSTDTGEVQAAYLASKQIGAEVADDVRQLARARNRAAQEQGFRDHFHKSLTLDEIDETWLMATFDKLDQLTREPFGQLKGSMDDHLARRFGLATADLRPWHYGDRFFQIAPSLSDFDLDQVYQGKDPVKLSLATYDGLGLEVRPILERSDLYARDGKNQHAFCLDLDREGDVRTLNNLEPNLRWIKTLLHELGHAVYDELIDRSLPWVLRDPPHTLSTEAVAILMGERTFDEKWLREVMGVSSDEARQVAEFAQQRQRAEKLIFTRWVLVMTNFERTMYADPDADLDNLWWDLVERYQQLTRPDGRSAPDWAAKYHIPLAPVYYHNYELGSILAAQIEESLNQRAGGLTGNKAAGEWLRRQVFLPGARFDWRSHAEHANRRPFAMEAFVTSLS